MKNRKQISECWHQYKWSLVRGFLTPSRWEKSMAPLTYISDYYGEKYGFYFAWLIHYTSWLLMPSLFGLILAVYQIITGMSHGNSSNELFDTIGNVYYAIFIALWATAYVESWKRKEATLGNAWLMRDFVDVTQERPKFKAQLQVNPRTKKSWKVSTVNSKMVTFCISFPIQLFFIGLIIVTQYFMRLWYLNITEDETITPAFYLNYAPACINAGLIIGYGILYKPVVDFIANKENHKF